MKEGKSPPCICCKGGERDWKQRRYCQGIPWLEHDLPEQRVCAFSRIHSCSSQKHSQKHSPQSLQAAQSWLQHFLGRAPLHVREAVVSSEMSTALSENCQSCVTEFWHWALMCYEDRGQPFGPLSRELCCITVAWTHPHHNRGREIAVHLVRLWQAGSVWKLVFDHILYQQDEPITSLGKELLLYPCGQEDQEPDYISLFEWTSPPRWAAPGLYSQRLNLELELLLLTWNHKCLYFISFTTRQ